MSIIKRKQRQELSPEARKQQKQERRKLLKVRFYIFVGLFLFTEIVLRIMGYKPGVVQDIYYQPGDAVYDSILYADEMGITHHLPTAQFYPGGKLNEDGYFSEHSYTKASMDSLRKQGKKIVMLVGDSFTAGCCPGRYDQAFAARLNNSDEYEVLNFGVGGVDPLHYELVVKKYLPIIEPDVVAVVAFLGNDIMTYNRTPKPYIPVCYPVKDGFWFNSEMREGMGKSDSYFKNFEEAKAFYYSFFSLRSDESNFFEKIIRNSIILSRIYLTAKIKLHRYMHQHEFGEYEEKGPFSYNHLKAIETYCNDHQVPVHFSAIPSVVQLQDEIDVRDEFGFVFNEIPWVIPEKIGVEDYDGTSAGSHYNAVGHQKFADFLRPKLERLLNE